MWSLKPVLTLQKEKKNCDKKYVRAYRSNFWFVENFTYVSMYLCIIKGWRMLFKYLSYYLNFLSCSSWETLMQRIMFSEVFIRGLSDLLRPDFEGCEFFSWIHLCLVLLQVPKCCGLVQMFCARPKIYLLTYCSSPIHFVPDKKMICIQYNYFFEPAQKF